MRVIIMGIDGLEYNLVEKWNVRGFKQEYYGKHDVKVAVKPGEPLYTPLIWASFLLGEPSYKYGFTHDFIEEKRVELGYKGPLRFLYRIRRRLLGRRRLGLRYILLKLGLFNVKKVSQDATKFETLPEEALKKTFVYTAERRGISVCRGSFPGLPGDETSKFRAELSQHFKSSLSERVHVLDELLDWTRREFNRVFSSQDSCGLTLFYTPLIDDAHHLLYRPRNLKAMTYLRRYYREVEQLVHEVRGSYGSDSLILVVSDHGYDPKIHEHSDYGFWSTNRDPVHWPKTILDFRKIIELYLYSK